jgi:hypothetical protein
LSFICRLLQARKLRKRLKNKRASTPQQRADSRYAACCVRGVAEAHERPCAG